MTFLLVGKLTGLCLDREVDLPGPPWSGVFFAIIDKRNSKPDTKAILSQMTKQL